MYVFADKPLGDSAERQQELGKVLPYSLRHIPVKRFYNNVAHSNVKSGLFFDHKISTNEMHRDKLIPENGILPVQPEYDPRSPPDASGARVWTTMERGNFYKNMKQNVWVKPGNVRMTRFTFADSLQGYGGGNAGTNTGAEVKDSVFVGRTDNKGMPDLWTDWSHPDTPSHQFDHSLAGSPYEPVTGVGFYQGPLFIDNCYFDRYYHDVWANDWLQLYGTNGVTYSGAISWARRNAYPSTPFSTVRGLKFGYCDDQNGGNWAMVGNSSMSRWDWNRDGTKQVTVRDEDGSLTGQAGTQLVQNRPFFTGPQCRNHDNWGLAACPYRYIQMEVTGNDGVLNVDKKKKFPLILRRDDVPSDHFMLQGEQKNTFLLRTHKSYTVSFNQTFGSGSVPTFISIEGYWLEAGDVVRIALCIPKDTTDFKIRSDYPPITYQQPPTAVLQVDDDTNPPERKPAMFRSGSVKRTRSPHGDTPPKPHDKVAKRGSANNADVEGGGGGDDPHEATGQQHERPMDEGLPDSLC
nr:hypothetical protein BaRGS_013056 [Batillaria attramentaria]